MLLDLLLVHFSFNSSVCPVWWTKLATCQLFYCTLNTLYRMVSSGVVEGERRGLPLPQIFFEEPFSQIISGQGGTVGLQKNEKSR